MPHMHVIRSLPRLSFPRTRSLVELPRLGSAPDRVLLSMLSPGVALPRAPEPPLPRSCPRRRVASAGCERHASPPRLAAEGPPGSLLKGDRLRRPWPCGHGPDRLEIEIPARPSRVSVGNSRVEGVRNAREPRLASFRTPPVTTSAADALGIGRTRARRIGDRRVRSTPHRLASDASRPRSPTPRRARTWRRSRCRQYVRMTRR